MTTASRAAEQRIKVTERNSGELLLLVVGTQALCDAVLAANHHLRHHTKAKLKPGKPLIQRDDYTRRATRTAIRALPGDDALSGTDDDDDAPGSV